MKTRDIFDLIIVRVDGGICSQISFCSLGLALQKRGYRVKYDLSFYRDNGLDSEGRLPRNWDMPKAFPSLTFEPATDAEIAALKKRHSRRSELVSSWEPPLYVGGYPDCNAALLEMLPVLREHFRPEHSRRIGDLSETMRASPSCAVHVRRGDLARKNPVYGEPTSVEYYTLSMSIVAANCPGVHFYFFSDEPSWVRENLLTRVPTGCRGTVVDENGSDRGYLDLYLISQCAYVISSIGSLGIYGALLSGGVRLLLLAKFSTLATRVIPSSVYVSRDGNDGLTSLRADAISMAIPESRLHGLWFLAYRVWRKLGLLLCRGAVKVEMFPAR